jgi:hypothetical protein
MPKQPKKVPVVVQGKDGSVTLHTGTNDVEIGAVHVGEETYIPEVDSWRPIQLPTGMGKTKPKRGLLVHEGHPLPVPVLREKETSWPNAAMLRAYYRANLAQGLSRAARGRAPGGDMLKSLLGLPKPVLMGLLVVVGVIIFILISPDYLDRVFGG